MQIVIKGFQNGVKGSQVQKIDVDCFHSPGAKKRKKAIAVKRVNLLPLLFRIV